MSEVPAIDDVIPGRPLPAVDLDTAPFYAAAARGELLIQRCKDTGRFQHYPRACSVYTGGEVEWVRASGRGAIYSFTIVRINPADKVFNRLVPYVIALVDLEEGVRMMGNVGRCDPESISVGMPVEVYFKPGDAEASIHLPFWAPADAATRRPGA